MAHSRAAMAVTIGVEKDVPAQRTQPDVFWAPPGRTSPLKIPTIPSVGSVTPGWSAVAGATMLPPNVDTSPGQAGRGQLAAVGVVGRGVQIAACGGDAEHVVVARGKAWWRRLAGNDVAAHGIVAGRRDNRDAPFDERIDRIREVLMHQVQHRAHIRQAATQDVRILGRTRQPAIEEAGRNRHVDAETQIDDQVRLALARLITAEEQPRQGGQRVSDREGVADAVIVQDADQMNLGDLVRALQQVVHDAGDKQAVVGDLEALRMIVHRAAAHIPLQARQAASEMRSEGGGRDDRRRIHRDGVAHGRQQLVLAELLRRVPDRILLRARIQDGDNHFPAAVRL